MADHIIGAAPSAGIPYDMLIRAIRKEGDELADRIGTHSRFMDSPGFKTLNVLDKHLLMLQLEQMRVYLHMLTIRLARFEEAKNGVLPVGAGALAKKPLIKPN